MSSRAPTPSWPAAVGCQSALCRPLRRPCGGLEDRADRWGRFGRYDSKGEPGESPVWNLWTLLSSPSLSLSFFLPQSPLCSLSLPPNSLPFSASPKNWWYRFLSKNDTPFSLASNIGVRRLGRVRRPPGVRHSCPLHACSVAASQPATPPMPRAAMAVVIDGGAGGGLGMAGKGMGGMG